MNKIYKLVWSKVRNTWVVASEIAKGHGKSSSPEGNGKLLKSLVLMALLGGFMTAGMSPVAAELTADQQAVYNAVMAELKASGKIEIGGKAGSITGIAIGGLSEASAQGTVAIGESAKGEFQSVAIGQDAQARWVDDTPNVSGNNIAIGASTRAYAANGIAQGNYASVYGTQGIAIGLQATVGEKPLTEQEYNDKVASGEISAADKKLYVRSEESNGNFVYRKLDTTGTDRTKNHFRGIAIGSLAQSNAVDSIALGSGAETYGDSSMATGYNAKAEGDYSMALGVQSKSKKRFSIAVGPLANAEEENTVAIGLRSAAKASGGAAIGAGSVATTAEGEVGYTTDAEQAKKLKEQAALAVEFNTLFKAYQNASSGSTEEAEARTKLQAFAQQHAEFMSAKDGLATWRATDGAVSVGANTQAAQGRKIIKTRQITNLAAGTQDTDAVNVAQLKVLNTKVDNNRKEMEKSLQNSTVKYFSINPEIDKRPAPADHSDNSKNDGAYGGHSIAIGGFAKASEENAIALGWSAKALDINSLAIGNMIYSYGSGSHAVGNQAAALADDASAFGYQAKAMDMGATALGNNSMAIQNGSTAVGYQSLAAVISTAVGANSFALGQASLALGPNSYTGDTTFRDTYTKYNKEAGYSDNVPGYYIGDLIKNNDDPKIAHYKEQFKDQLNGLDAHNQEALLKHLIIADLNKQVQFATAVGNHSTVGASQGTALGYNSSVTKKNGTALGYNSTVSADYGVALGNDSIADRGMRELGYNLTSTPWTSLSDLSKHGGFQDSEGLLQKDYKAWVEAYAEQEKKYREWKECSDLLEKDRLKDEYEDLKKKTDKAQLAYGKRQAVWRATEGAVSVGNREKAITRQIIGVAAGTEDTDAVNVAQLKAANSKIEANTKNITNLTTKVDNDKVKYFSVNPEYKIRDHADVNTTNEKNDGAIGKHSMAIGIKTVATGIQALAIGYGAVSEQQHGLAIGLGAKVSDKDKCQSLAIGNDAVVTANFGTAIGQGASVETDDGVAIGVSSLSYRRGTTPGYNPNMTTYTKDVTAYISNDIKQLMEKVKPLEQKERELRRAYQNETDPARKELADKAYKDWTAQHPELKEMQGKIEAAKAVWEDDCGTVSFGNDKLHTTSRLVNITAGLEDSDAVNVAQLKALNKKVEDIRDKSSVHYVSVNKEDDIFYDKEYKTNYDNTGASAKHSVAVGYKAAATVEDGVALGSKATAAVTAGKIGYLPGSTDSTIDGVLEKLQLKEKYAELKAKIEPLQAEYKKKLDAFDEARKDPDTMDGEEEDYQKWVTDHPDFMTALKEFNAIESTWKSGAGAISVGDKENGVTRQITNLAAGTEDTDAVNVAQLKAANYKIDKNTEHITNLTTKVEKGGVKYFSVNPKTENLPTANISPDNAANDGATGMESMAIGKGARAAGQQSIVIGQNAVSEHHGGSIVIGQDAKASGDSEWHGVVVGSRAEVTGGSGVALGNDSKVTAGDGVALGFGSLADREWNVLGYTPDRNANSLQDRLAGTEYDELVKKLAPLITEHNQLVDDFNHENDPIKKKEKHEKYEAWQAAHPDYNADVKKRDMLKSAWKSGGGAVSVGNSELNATRQIIGVAAGSEDTDAVNVAQLKALNKKVDTNTETINNLNLKVGKGGVHYFSVKADDSGRPAGTNYDNDGATGDFAIAAGYSSVAAGANSIAVGFQAKSPGSSGVAVGNKASANNTSDIAMGINAESSGSWGVAIGGNSQAKGASGIALGQQAKAESQSGIAIGVQSEATGIWGVAIGQNAKAQATTSVAIACRAEAQNENSVAIGNFAKAIGATSTVIGAQATASGTWGTSVGFFAEASSENGTAIGVNSKARAKKGIALGAYSVADREGRRIGYSLGGDNSTIDNVLESVGLTEKYNQLESVVNPLIDEYKSLVGVFTKAADGSAEKAAAKENLKKWEMEHPDFMSATTEMKKILTAWRSGSGAFSIGNEEYGITRQIIGVAAGSEDTDAVNVAQLKALATAPMGFDVGGKVENNVYTPGAKNWTMPLNGLRMSFGDGLLAEEVTDKDGKKYTLVKMNDEITIGKVGENGKDGKIGINGKDGHSAEITVGKGKDGVDGTNGENGITRIIYKDQGNQPHEVATLDDGLKFKGDNDAVVIRKLNTQLNITGGAAATDLSDGNIGIVGTAGDNGGLAVKLSKKLTGLTSAEFKDGDNITNITGGNISVTKKVNNQNETKNIDLWDLSTTVEGNTTNINNIKQSITNLTTKAGKKIHYLAIGPDNESNLAQGGNYDNDGVEQHWGIAIGVDASSKDGDGIAMGKDSRSRGYESIGLGSLSSAVGDYTTATGHKSQAFGDSASAFGTLARAYGANGVAIGGGALVSNSKSLTKAEYDALPEEEKALYHTEKAEQEEFYQYKQKNASGEIKDIEVNGVAVGNFAKSMGKGGVAIGDHAKASDKDNIQNSAWGVALGAYSQNKVQQGVAIGTLSVADRAKDVKGYLPTTGKSIENFEEVIEATGKTETFNQFKKDYAAATAKLNEAKTAYEANTADNTLKTAFEQAQKKVDDLTNQAAVMTAPWISTKGAVSVGNEKQGKTRQIIGVAAGSEDTDAVNVAQLKALNTKVDKGAIHYFSVKSTATGAGSNYNNDGAKKDGGIAIGKQASATGTSDIAIGTEAQATGGWGVAIGQAAKAKASTAVAMAYAAEAKGKNSLAIGIQSEAKTNDSAAYGREAKALGEVALAVGVQAKAEGDHSAVFGAEAVTDSTAWNGTAIGRGAYIGKQAADGTTPDTGVSNNYYTPVDDDTVVEAGKETMNSTAVGFGAKAFGYQNTALGSGAEAFDTNTVAVGVMSKAIGHYANALGKQARAKGKNSTAIGHFARALGESSMALGDYAITSTLDGTGKVNQSVALGSHARVTADNSLALGNNSLASIADDVKTEAYLSKEAFKKENGIVSVGNKAYTIDGQAIEENYRRIANVAGGADDHDAVNVAQLKTVNTKVDKNAADITTISTNITELNTKVGEGVHYFSVNDANSKGDNYDNKGATGKDSIAIGKNTKSSGNYTVAVGNNAEAAAMNAVAVGWSAKAKERFGVAIGQGAVVSAAEGVAIGTSAEVAVTKGVAIGPRSYADRNPGMLGYAPGVKGNDLRSIIEALGLKDRFQELVGIATPFMPKYLEIGEKFNKASAEGDTAAQEAAMQEMDQYKADHPEFTQALYELNTLSNTWQASESGVAIGDSRYQNTRQLTGVAAGTKDTDAVNVAQLKLVDKKVDKNAADITTINTNITNLKGGFTIKDTANGTVDVALGETKPAITFKAETKKDDEATSALTAKVDADKNVTYTLNTKKLKEEMGLTQGVGSMSSWKLKATKDTTSEVIADGDEVEFAVETADKGLTVKREGKKIQYGINADKLVENINSATTKITNVDGDNIDLSKNTSIKTINENITKMAGKATKVTVDDKDDNSDDADASLKITSKTVDGQTTYNLSLNDKITIGKDGKDGKIGLNGQDGKSAEITVGQGKDGVDGTNGENGITRIIYKDQGNQTRQVATLDDGLKFKGDNDSVVIRKLNNQLDIKGGATAADLSDNNIGVVGTADADGQVGNLTVKLSKKLTGLTSAEFKDGDNTTTITGGNISITRKEGDKTTKVDLWELNKTVNNITAGTTGGSWKLQANGANERTIAKDGIVNFKNGTNTEVTVNGNDITVDLNEDTKKQITDNTTKIKNIGDRVTNIETNIDTKIEQKMEGAKITVEGDKDTGVKATEVKDGDKVTGYKVSLDEKITVGKVIIDGTKEGTNKKGEITGLTNTTVDATDFATKGRAATEEQLKAAMDKVQTQSRTTVKGSENIKVTPKTTSAAEYTVELAKDISVDNVTVKDKITAKTVNAGEKVTVGDTVTIDKNGLTIKDGPKDGPSVTTAGINAGGKKVTGVAPGDISKDSKDVVTGGQLFATNQQVVSNMSQINSLRDESREGDAMGAAMAALKPLDFNPYQRSQVMAGVGYYRGKEAVALGLAHYKNEDLMFHGGLAYAGNSDLMANVGVSYRFGSSEDKEAQKARNLRMPQYDKGPISSVYILQDEVQSLQRENDAIRKENKEAKDRIAALEAKLEKVLEKVK